MPEPLKLFTFGSAVLKTFQVRSCRQIEKSSKGQFKGFYIYSDSQRDLFYTWATVRHVAWSEQLLRVLYFYIHSVVQFSLDYPELSRPSASFMQQM